MDKTKKKIIPFRKQMRDRRAMAVFLAVLAMLVLVLIFFVVDGGRNWDAVQRFFAYGNTELRIERGAITQWAQLDGALVTAGADGVVCYDEDGNVVFVASAELSSPEIKTGKETVLAYDAGGNQLVLMNDDGTILLNPPDLGTIYDADLSPDGTMACISDGSREKTILQVYDRKQLVCFTVYSDTRYLARCAVSPNAERVCAVALGEEDGNFNSTAVIYDTDREEPVAELSLGNQMIYDVEFWGKDTICLIGEKSLITINTKGERLGTYEFGVLLDYTLEGEDFCALVVGDETGYSLVTLNKKCRTLGTTILRSADVQVAAGGKYLAWIDDGMLYMSSPAMPNVKGQEVDGIVSGLCVDDPGVCYVLDSRGATRYLP